jgi:hypothetical protein
MKKLADWIRRLTPAWTDDQRYYWLSLVHSWLVPICLGSFLYFKSVFLRFAILCIQSITVITEFYYKDCIITAIEKEFSNKTWDDVMKKMFDMFGWPITRPEKMTLNIGINVGVLVAFLAMLLSESWIWILGIALLLLFSVCFTMFILEIDLTNNTETHQSKTPPPEKDSESS